MTDKPADNFLKRGLKLLSSAEIREAPSAIRSIASYELSASARKSFLAFHSFVTGDPPPQYITRWRSDADLEHWYKDHVGGILDNVQNALAAAYYHRDRLVSIESALNSILKRIDFQSAIPRESTVAVGGTLKLDFEYQAFVLASRRCLDYMTRALAAYFQHKFHSFHKMPKALRGFHSPVGIRLSSTCAAHTDAVAFLLPHNGTKSIRDLISHYYHVQAGIINLTTDGFVFAGGGEKINLRTGPGQALLLSQIIDERLAALQLCVDEHIYGFIEAALEEQAKRG
jgi:hypothetical protein